MPSSEDSAAVFEGFFDFEEPLQLTLKVDLKSFRKNRRSEEYIPVEMTCHAGDSFQVSHPVRIKARGVFRRDNCSTPPFWLNIRDSGIKAEGLKDIKQMKVVIPCRSPGQYELYVLREYLVYKIFNIISPYSFRVRLVKLTFIDTSKRNRVTEDWAFIIEPEELMEKRLNGTFINNDELSMRNMNRRSMDLVALFQYMIGNGDYSVIGRHNLEIITVQDPGVPGFIPVPYDFDYTGLVNAEYAVPGERLGILTVRERYYLGACRTEQAQQVAIDKIASHREEILEYINGFEYLDQREKRDMAGYLESYFEESGEARFIARRITPTCR